jgi:uncharacterized PurR-regulated membrane protein YhhQ (DUF165 family)
MDGGAVSTKGIIALATYILTIVAANWAIATFGMVGVGFGLLAPAGVYFAGLAFTLRDAVQETLGRRWAVGAIAVGALLSALISGPLAIASGAAFLVSELCDFVVYTPLREKNRALAVLLSNTVGAVVDSALFLWLAFGSLEFLSGQVLGKSWTTLLAVALMLAIRSRGLEAARA